MKPTIILKPTYNYCFFETFKFLLLSILIIVVSLLFGFRFLTLFAIPLVFLSFFKYAVLRNIKYEITDQQIIITAGIFTRQQTFYELYRIKDFVVTKNFVEQLLGVMTVVLITSDNSIPNLTLTGIPNSDIVQTIRNYVQACRDKNHVYTFS